MKRNIKYNLFGLMAMTMLLGATSCKDDTFNSYAENGDEVRVTFSLNPEGSLASTRADATAKISDGSKADMLIYAVYDENGELLEEYGQGKGSGVPSEKTIGFGQTAIMTDFPSKITITLKRGEKYKVAFWAQSSKTNAYDTEDLKKVEVNYGVMQDNSSSTSTDVSSPNNDEFRDAFCRTVDVIPSTNGNMEQNVNLFRPLAQINVGTSGYDYEIATRETNTKYVYSKIRINRVARYLDVIEDKTYTSTTTDDEIASDGSVITHETPEAFAVVDYDWAPLPAYANMYTNDQNPYAITIPQDPSYTIWDWTYNSGFSLNGIDKSAYEKEYFLTVHRDFNGVSNAMPEVGSMDKNGDGFRDYANLNNYNNKESETFKYLSMCYVLTASTNDDPVVINNVKMWLSPDGTDANAIEVLNINHVPAQKNWRTNIIGNLLTEENTFEIKLDRAFAGEYSGWSEDGENWKFSGPLADGMYYDGANDVIEISSVEGLLTFQQMVNGTMKVREGNYVGEDYPYYTSTGSTATLKYPGFEKPDDEDLVERILVATHQKYNQNPDWPKSGNFHFTGQRVNDAGETVDYPATVKLMCDIDLSNEEWIPIGFDGRIGEQPGYTLDEASDKYADNRVFYGIFDGNGHTVYNMTTKRFSANVHEKSQQLNDATHNQFGHSQTQSKRPVDNPQWWGRGFFGQIGGNAKVKNLKLSNVDVYGCNGVAGIVGLAYGNEIEITDCVVDGGSIIATPMYRGDSYPSGSTSKNRTFARGVYMGGIVGYFNTRGGRVDNCVVRNAYLQGVRRVGGLIGSINQVNLGKDGTGAEQTDEGKWIIDEGYQTPSKPASIANNRLENVIFIASSYSTYGMKNEIDQTSKTILAGFGYNSGNLSMYAQKFVGGHADAETSSNRPELQGGVFRDNSESGLTFAHFPIDYVGLTRSSEMEGVPLQYMPLLSSWYVDEVKLNDNYYGEPSAYTRINLKEFNVRSSESTKTGYTNNSTNFNSSVGQLSKGGNTFYYPMNVPEDVTVNFDTGSGRVGLFVESISLDGSGGIGGRSVITPNNVDKEGDCVIYLTGRNRHQFGGENFLTGEFVGTTAYKIPTKLNHIIVRGNPYAYTGILIAQNKNMRSIELNNVAVYDVFQTIASADWSTVTDQKVWPNNNAYYDTFKKQAVLPLTLNSCNLRGYTHPGDYWNNITYNVTTFERGANTGHGDLEYTCKVMSLQTPPNDPKGKTQFNGCYFKAPFIIDLTDVTDMSDVVFTDSYATSSSQGSNVKIQLPAGKKVTKIEITNNQGRPVVTYYNGTAVVE